MSFIKTVAVLGATGSLGDALIPALLNSGFDVTCITRPQSKATVPKGSRARIADYTDIVALTDALQGQDAIVEAFNPASSVHQSLIVQASLAAGVKHIITPDFSGDTFNENLHEVFIFVPKRLAQNELESAVAASGGRLSWTAIITSVWYDWAIEMGIFWLDREKRVISRYGSGNQKYSMSRRALNGDALVDVLKNPHRYRNRAAYFASHTVTTNQLIAMVGELGLEGWTVVDIPVEGYVQEAHKLWQQDTDNGVQNRLASQAYKMFSWIALQNESNRYGSDFTNKVEVGWDEGREALKRDLRAILSDDHVSL